MKERESQNHFFFNFVKGQSLLILILAALTTLFFALQIPKLRFDTDYLSLLPKESSYREGNFNPEKEEVEQSLEEKNPSPPRERLPYTSSYFFVVESEDLFDPTFLSILEEVMKELEVLPEFGSKFSAFEYTTLENNGGRLSFVPLSPKTVDSPWSEEEALLFKERLLRDDVAKNYLVSADGKALLIYYQIKPEGAGSDRLRAYSEILEPLREHARVYINGTAPISERVLHYLKKDLFTLLFLSLVCIILIYYLAFRSKRSVFLPLSLAFISLIWTLGMMSLLNFTLSIISIITPTIVITLGSSYSIHLLNEYFRQGAEGDPPDLPRVTARVAKTISLAALTTVIGFLSLLSAETRAFRQFGISVSLGVFFCALLSLTYLPALLSLLKPPKRRPAKEGKTGLPEKILETLAEVSLKRYPLSLIIFLLFLAGFLFTKDRIGIESNYMSYFPKQDPLFVDSLEIARTMGGLDPFRITLKAPEKDPGYFFRPEVIKQIHDFELAIKRESQDIVHILSFPSYISFMQRIHTGTPGIPERSGLLNLLYRYLSVLKEGGYSSQLNQIISSEGKEITLVIRYYDGKQQGFQTGDSSQRVLSVLEKNLPLLPEDLSYRIWGSGIQIVLLNEVITRDQRTSTYLAFLLVLLSAFIFFRSLKFGLYSIVPILAGVMGNYIFMFLSGIPLDLVTLGFGSITLGVGIDDALHFLIKLKSIKKEEPEKPLRDALKKTLMETGRPIILTSLALMAGLIILTFASYIPIRYFGLLISFALLNTLLATLFLLPAVILFLEKRRVSPRTVP